MFGSVGLLPSFTLCLSSCFQLKIDCQPVYFYRFQFCLLQLFRYLILCNQTYQTNACIHAFIGLWPHWSVLKGIKKVPYVMHSFVKVHDRLQAQQEPPDVQHLPRPDSCSRKSTVPRCDPRRWRSRYTATAATQSGKHLKSALRCPSMKERGLCSIWSQCGSICV